MADWFDDVEEKDRDKVKKLYTEAKNESEKINVLKDWHQKGYANIDAIKNLEEYFKFTLTLH